MDEFQKVLGSSLALWEKYSGALPGPEYVSVRDSLVDAPTFALLVPHCLVVAIGTYKHSEGRYHFLKSIVLTFLAAFGGTTLSSILSAVPAPVGSSPANQIVPCLLICWWFIHCVPLVRNICTTRLVLAKLTFFAHFAKIRAISLTVDHVSKLVPDGWAASIVLGGIAGCGGMFFMDFDKLVQSEAKKNSILTEPTWGLKSAFLMSVLYYLIRDPHNFVAPYIDLPMMERSDIIFALSTALALTASMQVLTGYSINFFHYIEQLIITVLGLGRQKPDEALSEKDTAMASMKKTN